MPADPTRRVVLAASAVLPLLVVGCRGTQVLGTPPQPSGAVRRLRAAIAAEERMVARYQSVIALLAHDRTAGSGSESTAQAALAAMLAEHREHLRQLQSRLIPGSPRAADAGPVPTGPASPVPAAPRQAISYLSAAEQAASDRLLGAVLLVPPSLAQLFASISASEATHVPVLQAAAVTA
ncbi:MAG: hypothetical protein ACRDNZ_10985 [Streptosporangiaceae bacterium]